MPSPRPRRSRKAGSDALAGLGLHAAGRRRALGLTQRDLADLAGVSVDTVHAVEAGRPSVQMRVLLAVLETLGLALVALPRSTARGLSRSSEAVLVEVTTAEDVEARPGEKA